VTGKNDLFYCM